MSAYKRNWIRTESERGLRRGLCADVCAATQTCIGSLHDRCTGSSLVSELQRQIEVECAVELVGECGTRVNPCIALAAWRVAQDAVERDDFVCTDDVVSDFLRTHHVCTQYAAVDELSFVFEIDIQVAQGIGALHVEGGVLDIHSDVNNT